MSMNINQTIKFMIDNCEGVNIDEILQHLLNIKYNQKIINAINEEVVEVVEEVKEEIIKEESKSNERILCPECNIDIIKMSKSRHYKTKKHIKNANNNRIKEVEECNLMQMEDTNINDIPPPIPAVEEIPAYQKSKHYTYEEVEENAELIERRIYYKPTITEKILLKYHPEIVTNSKYTVVKYRDGYTVVIYIKLKKKPVIEEQKANYSEEEMNDINEKWHCNLCQKTLHRIQRKRHLKDLIHIYKRELKKKYGAAAPFHYDNKKIPENYKSDPIVKIDGLEYCWICRMYYQEHKEVHLQTEKHLQQVAFNRNI